MSVFVSVFMFVFTVLTLNLDRIVNGYRLSSEYTGMCTQIPIHTRTHGRAHARTRKVTLYMFTQKPTHTHTYKLTRKGSAFPEPQSGGLGTLDLVIISRAVSFDLLLMSVLGSSHL